MAPDASGPTIRDFFGPEGPLARVLPGFEERPSQRRFSEAVECVLWEGGRLLAEAGTGTGKTLAYLLPAVELDRRVVVSTGTKNLQEQLLTKDIPLLAEALGREISVAVMKGRGNYLCLQRFRSFSQGGSFRRIEEIPLFKAAVAPWALRTRTGDRGEVPDLPDSVDFWREISAASENCIGQSCPDFEPCWVTRMRQQAIEADLVVVNHHLLCADLAVKESSYGEVIPPYDTLILDEAHLIEDVATQYFGLQFSSHRVEDLCRDVEREIKAAAVVAMEVVAEVVQVRLRSETFFTLLRLLSERGPRRLGPGWMTGQVAEAAGALVGRLEGLRTALLALHEKPEALTALAGRALALGQEAALLTAAADDSHVYFVEARGKGVFLRATPIDVSRLLRELLWDRLRATVLTSATLAVDGGFAYLKHRLGIEAEEELLLPSPFDYSRQAILYVPRGMPEPQSAAFVSRAAEEIRRLLEISRGRAFVLFTSHANMNAVAELLAGEVSFPLFIQGEAPKSVLLEMFRRTPGAVLLATASFWQGVDVAGDQLSCVIVDKLPFASPADPVVSARIDWLRGQGGRPFDEYQVPVAVLMLKQGLGRLIRSTQDRGILAVLDSRLLDRGYGRRFLADLPPARLVHDLDDVEGFFAETAALD
jgi:ATP-dependent DNA helicase DinG